MNAMVTNLFLIRHGRAEPNKQDHTLSNLSTEGIAQARAFRRQLNDPTFDLVIASDLPRATQTAEIVAGCKKDTVIKIPTLFYQHDPEAPLLDESFKRLKHSPVNAWYADEHAPILRRAARRAMEDLIAEILTHEKRQTVLSVGHGILIPPMIDSLFRLSRDALSQPLSECEGFIIKLDSDKIVAAERIL